MADDGFHEGELSVQRRAGVTTNAQRLARMLTDPDLSGAMSRFVAERDLVFVTSWDGAGTLWTSPVFGPPGFCAGIGRTLTIAATVAEGDPLHDLVAGRPVGVLLVDFARRRRLRVNGVVRNIGSGGLEIDVQQAFGNCPRYIRTRDVAARAADPDQPAGGASRRCAELEPEHIAQITAADTFILGTIHPGRGADTSHRGGEPGFVRCADGELSWPDYPGNNLFNSLGNIVVNPATALLFLDFERRTSIQLSGRGSLEWGPFIERGATDGTRRRVRFAPERIVFSPASRGRSATDQERPDGD